MILELIAKQKKAFALTMLTLLYFETVIPSYALGAPVRNVVLTTPTMPPPEARIKPAVATGKQVHSRRKPDLGGPTQPEMQAFHSVNDDNMVDLFTGDFSYSIPLIDVEGYPIALGYNSGISMDQEASWVGLGWNLNPGTITRNMRGIPDDFDGSEKITKTAYQAPNNTTGGTVGIGGIELFGKALNVGLGLGLLHNTYKGWGLETYANANISAASKSAGRFTAGMSLNNSSQNGFTVSPSLSYSMDSKSFEMNNQTASPSVSVGLSYNTRAGLKDLQFTAGLREYTDVSYRQYSNTIGGAITFAHPSYTPTITLPFTGTYTSYSGKLGFFVDGASYTADASAYFSKQEILLQDTTQSLAAFGYLNYQKANGNASALLDYNREKDLPYCETPATPNIAVPAYTYDVFSISGEGTGGMFRAYRGDIGYVYDHHVKTKDKSTSLGAEIAPGTDWHYGVDISLNQAYTENGPWQEENQMALAIPFRDPAGAFEAAYFRNPNEKAVNDKAFYRMVGGDDVVNVHLDQSSNSDPSIYARPTLDIFRNKKLQGHATLSADSIKTHRDKRTQVISYLNATEATAAGLTKYIDSYTPNQFSVQTCLSPIPADDLSKLPHGLKAQYFSGEHRENLLFEKTDTVIDYANVSAFDKNEPSGAPGLNRFFSARWSGRLKVDITGIYQFIVHYDDGIQLSINDSMIINNYNHHADDQPDIVTLNLVAGQVYPILLDFFQNQERATMKLEWQYGGLPAMPIPAANLYPPAVDTPFMVRDANSQILLTREKRVDSVRKGTHISEMDVLNEDGRRYVYGIPVYNFIQDDVSFSADGSGADLASGLVNIKGGDASTHNGNGNEKYYSREEVPAYAHSFLLTGILSPDYMDLTGDGISDDDPGNAVKFNYSKIAGVSNPYQWRTPYNDKASYSENLKTDTRDDKGSYVYGEKELWYLHSIESKNMIATFKTSDRTDMPAITEAGQKLSASVGKKLDEINLYTKADFKKYGTNAIPVKTVHFEYSYDLCPGINGTAAGKLTLKRLWFTYNGNNKGALNPYVFNYNPNNPGYQSGMYDRWGNYKNAADNPGSTAGNMINNAEYPYALQDSTKAAANIAAWTLDSIGLPSGGKMKIDYESDDYAYVQNRRATQMFKIAGFSVRNPDSSTVSNKLYSSDGDNLYISINVPRAVNSKDELFARYLDGIDTLFFRVFVKMPSDDWGSGSEYISTYATMEDGTYGFYNGGNTIWLKLKAIDDGGRTGGSDSRFSPLATAGIEYLRNNLPSKAYPGSDIGDESTAAVAIKLLFTQVDNVVNLVQKYDVTARNRDWVSNVDLSRSYVRLDNPYLKKYGGGLRVKRIRIYDNWNTMTKQRQAVFGQEYEYTGTQSVNGVNEVVSSGVASWEPSIGGEENPWHTPLEYDQQVSALAPVSMGYSELPLGEEFYQAPVIGYSKVRVRALNTKNTRSASGYTETCFYTNYDFPTLTDMTLLADSKKRFKPALANFLKINARHFIAVSQGFKVELNDMNGKVKSQASYNESGAVITKTENFYHVDNIDARNPHLNNQVMAIDPHGNIDTAALIGEDVELMMDMREEHSVTSSPSLNLNTDAIDFLVPPILIIPIVFDLLQHEETKFHSAATTKVINRHGILDSVIVTDKGSRVLTSNLLYDGETGDVVLSSTQNEFNDPYYHFSWPAAWAYDGMAGAYKNIGVTLSHMTIRNGKMEQGQDTLFASGDEIVVTTRQRVAGVDCVPAIATFPAYTTIYAVDANMQKGGARDIYFTDRDGQPFTGNDITLKVIRSGRRNISAVAGEVTMLKNPLVNNNGVYSLNIDANSQVTAAAATEFKQYWKVADKKRPGVIQNTVVQSYTDYAAGSNCGPHYYGNKAISGAFADTACGSGAAAPQVVLTIPADRYASPISQQAADDSAAAALAYYGPINAQIYGNCDACLLFLAKQAGSGELENFGITITDPNGGDSVVFNKGFNDLGNIDLSACYNFPRGVYDVKVASIIPLYVTIGSTSKTTNSNGVVWLGINFNLPETIQFTTDTPVIFHNQAGTVTLQKNDCPAGEAGSFEDFPYVANTDTSIVSQQAANNKAIARTTANGQPIVNAQGVCSPTNQVIITQKAGAGDASSAVIGVNVTDNSGNFKAFNTAISGIPFTGTIPSNVQAPYTFTISAMSTGYMASVNGGPAISLTSAGTSPMQSNGPILIQVWKQ